MKFRKRVITLFVAVLALAMFLPSAFAVSNTSAEPGTNATVTFTFKDVYNVDGAFEVNDPQNILTTFSFQITDAGTTAATINGNRMWASPGAEPVKTTVTVVATLTLKPTAPVGATCTVSFSGIYGDGNEEPGNEHDVTQSAILTVKETTVTPTATPTHSASPTPTENPTVTPAPTTTPTPATTPTATPSPEPTSTVFNVDYSELQNQIAIASGLKTSDYTDQSREILVDALSDAKAALNFSEQSLVTAAAEKLRDAIAGLTPMNFNQLKAALSEAEKLLELEKAAILWQNLAEATEHGTEMLRSGDQNAVDQATADLTKVLDLIATLLEEESEVDVVIQEVPVEVLPQGDYCNVEAHHLWPVLFAISAVLNVALIGVIVAYIIKKTKNRKDIAPLVDYDIDDDM